MKCLEVWFVLTLTAISAFDLLGAGDMDEGDPMTDMSYDHALLSFRLYCDLPRTNSLLNMPL